MVYFNDRTFAAGRVPIKQPVHGLYALPLPCRQTPEESPPSEAVEVPQWAKSGTTFDFYNPLNNSFAPTPNAAVINQIKQQQGVRGHALDGREDLESSIHRHAAALQHEEAERGRAYDQHHYEKTHPYQGPKQAEQIASKQQAESYLNSRKKVDGPPQERHSHITVSRPSHQGNHGSSKNHNGNDGIASKVNAGKRNGNAGIASKQAAPS